MKRLPRLLCFLLALAWVPLTQHCDLEVLGMNAAQCHDGGSTDGDGCAGDACKQVESGDYKLPRELARVTSPQLLALLCVIRQSEAPVSLSEVNEVEAAGRRPDDWIPSWQFARRAAPPARAPSWMGA